MLLVALAGAGVWYVNSGQFIRTPAVLDKPRSEATKTLSDAGVDVKVKQDYSERVKRGHVISSDPKPGERVRKTGSVTLTVSRGPQVVKVPDLRAPRSRTPPEAEGRRAGAGAVKRRFDPETAQGSVIATDPAPGSKRRPSTAVALTVSKGAAVEVPDVVGDDRSDAMDELKEAGLKVRIASERVHSEHDKGTIARQSPTDSTRAAKGDMVTLTVSKGPEMLKVPDVEDSSEDEATSKLEQAGFAVNVRRIFFGDTVFNQSPRAARRRPGARRSPSAPLSRTRLCPVPLQHPAPPAPVRPALAGLLRLAADRPPGVQPIRGATHPGCSPSGLVRISRHG